MLWSPRRTRRCCTSLRLKLDRIADSFVYYHSGYVCLQNVKKNDFNFSDNLSLNSQYSEMSSISSWSFKGGFMGPQEQQSICHNKQGHKLCIPIIPPLPIFISFHAPSVFILPSSPPSTHYYNILHNKYPCHNDENEWALTEPRSGRRLGCGCRR